MSCLIVLKKQGWPLNIIQGKDYIEVRPEGVGKGKVVGHLLNKMRVDGNPADFVLCIGDDVADELMFDQLKKMVTHEELPKGRFSLVDDSSLLNLTTGF